MGAARRRPGTVPALTRQPPTHDLALVRQLFDLGDLADNPRRRQLYRLAGELRRAASAVPAPAELAEIRQQARQVLGVLL